MSTRKKHSAAAKSVPRKARKPKPPCVLTLSRLYSAGACLEQMELVEKEWPDGIPLTKASAKRTIELHLDLAWAGERLLNPSLRSTFWVKCAAAWKKMKTPEYKQAQAEILLDLLLQEPSR